MMHKISLQMQDPGVMKKVAKRCSVSVAMNDSFEAQQIELTRKHITVQEMMVNDVYLSEKYGAVSIYEASERSAVISQYVGVVMMRFLQSEGKRHCRSMRRHSRHRHYWLLC
mmetsp:Transcript_24257/g.52323  ORF Transcript_24257/g.52323 Transcript_24257/m.52323 type:complete len:112 (-) Transcript_24257:30-365(-)